VSGRYHLWIYREANTALVPSQLTEDEFWKRYYFRVHQIQSEEEKRKTLLEGISIAKIYLYVGANNDWLGSISTDEDFSWEDDDDEDESSKAATPPPQSPKTLQSKSSSTTLQPAKEIAAASQPETLSTATSPRESSDGSYAVIGVPSNTVKAAEVKGTDKKADEEANDDEDDDGDEEDGDEDEDEDEDEEDEDDDDEDDDDEDEDDDDDKESGNEKGKESSDSDWE